MMIRVGIILLSLFFTLYAKEGGVFVAPSDPSFRYVGRFDFQWEPGPRAAWSASRFEIEVDAQKIEIEFNEDGKNLWQVIVNGVPQQVLSLRYGKHRYTLEGSFSGQWNRLEFVKRTEAEVGTTQFLGLHLSGEGKWKLPSARTRRIEAIGDSITCGYGNEASSKEEKFTPETQNATKSYVAIVAQKLNADYQCVAWSGKKMAPDNTIPELYDRILPQDPASVWEFLKSIPDVVVINLGTNDFFNETPEEEMWVKAYIEFIKRVRKNYPEAMIYCASGPCMGDGEPRRPLSTLIRYLKRVVSSIQSEGDKNIRLIEFATQKESDGIGAQWHPSVRTHEIMAEKLLKSVREDLSWKE